MTDDHTGTGGGAVGAVGQPLSRVDGPLKVTGRADYAADHDLPGLVHAVLVTATTGRGTTTVDADKASAAPGVLTVLTSFDGVTLPFKADQVNFFGQPVAIVVADTLERAEHAASLVEVSAAPAPALTDIDAPQATPQPAPRTQDYHRGDPDGALRAAPIVLDQTYTIMRENHNPMELPATIASWQGNQLTVWDKTQWVQGTARSLASALGVSPGDVRVISPFVGGAFGSAGATWPHQILAAFAARQLRRPVKLALTRRQMYAGIGYRPTSRQRLAVGADPDGTIRVLVHEARTETARYQNYEDAVVALPRFLYGGPNLRSDYRLVPLDVHAPTYMRGPGAVTGAFALESMMDELAYRLGIDPIQLRLRNDATSDLFTGLPFSTRGLAACLHEGARTFGWERRNPAPRSQREGPLLVGLGMAGAAYHTGRSPATSLARVNDDGTAVVASATSDMGPGTYTSMTQVAADALGLPIDKVSFRLGDSALPQAPVHAGSQTMASVGSAVFTAASSLRDSFVRMAVVDPASPLHGAAPADVSVRDGRLFVTSTPDRADTYQQILRRHQRTSLDTQQPWTPGDAPHQFSTYGYGAVFAEVAVDERLGLTRVRRLHATYDAGRIVNPKLARSQAIGAMVGGIGMALLEGTVTDHRDGRIVNANLADYLVPTNADVPDLDATFLDTPDPRVGPLGAKGLGELVIVGVPAAIANAVFHATGTRVRDLPITLDKLL
jgi:xanthine dehydrogenase YagR molybdenum-binding subunit